MLKKLICFIISVTFYFLIFILFQMSVKSEVEYFNMKDQMLYFNILLTLQ